MTPNKFGRYEIISELGRGGMATVYHAYDPHFERDVAVKVLPREYLFHPQARPRFQREARAIAALEHPAIVPVYDYGEQDGQPYLVMRYMSGGSLSARIHVSPLTVREAAPILARLGSALDEAHAQGIIHRDLKPDNILFDQRGDAYLVDFGIVKLAQATTSLTTGSGFVGTPAYMSPEQVHGDIELDGRSDIYALGVVLFEMLTGHAPYDADTPTKLMMNHVLEPVPSIMAVSPDLPPACEAVIARAMAKDRDERYPVARELAAAVAAIAGGEAVVSAHPAPQAVAPRVSLKAEQVHTLRGHKDTVWSVTWSPDGARLASGSYDGRIILWNAQTGEQLAALEVQTRGRGVPWSLAGHAQQGVRGVAWSPSGALLVSGSDDGVLTIWDPQKGGQLGTLEGHEQAVRSVAWSPDGAALASGSEDGTVMMWDIQSGERLGTLEGHTRGVRGVAWSPDGTRLASGSYDGKVMLWNVQTSECLGALEGHTRGVRGVAWSPDGARLVSALYDGTLTLWDAATGDPQGTLQGHAESVHSVAWSPDGAMLVSGSHDGTIIVWDVHANRQMAALQGHSDAVRCVTWSPDGAMLASGSDDRLVILWKLAL